MTPDSGQKQAARSLEAGLAAFLAETWGTKVEVESLAVASAGARRRSGSAFAYSPIDT